MPQPKLIDLDAFFEADPAPGDVVFYYHRRDAFLRLKHRAMTNHEIREIICGLWARLDADDRADHIEELLHYQAALLDPRAHPDRFLSPMAEAIRRLDTDDPRVIDLTKFRRGN